MRRRAGAIFGAITIMAAVLALGPTPAGAAGTLTPWSSSVEVGATFSVTASGCPNIEEETDDGFTYQQAQLILITGSGADERLAAFGQGVSSTRHRFEVPGWVDPAQPAVIAGSCVRTTYVFTEEDEVATTTTLFTYADAAIDITAGTSARSGPTITLDRNVAAGGQVVTVTGTGCEGSEYAQAVLYEGSDLSGRTATEFASGGGAEVRSDGTFEIEIALNDRFGSSSGGGPLAEGPYAVLAGCDTGNEETGFAFASPLPLTVSGANPSGSFVVEASDGTFRAMGSGCVGQPVSVRLEGYAYSGFEELRARDESLRTRSVFDSANVLVDDNGEFGETYEVTPDADGSWALDTAAPDGSWELMASADCGDPVSTGFRYVSRYLYENSSADLYIERASPTSSPAGGPIQLTVGGYCEGEVAVAVLDADRQVLSRSEPFALSQWNFGTGTTDAPETPGSYYVAGICDEEFSYPQRYEVFAPKTVSAEAPLAEEPAEGWPSRGARETYRGKIGPIDLPAMEMGEEMAGTKALGPGGLFIPVPRPSGDFAITKLTFDLVDADGMPVSQDAAHLHHFVITNKSAKNPACPGSTFGLPGQIVGAAGAERTVLQTGDPYGLVVKDTDDWTGVYELMSRSMEDQTVFLSYDIDYRRDVDNVRPVTTYFGSASGCSSFTWTIDGSGTPDTQTQFVTIAKPGRLIGAGGHIHNGGMHADWTNDRGRRLCRSEITYGDEPVGHTQMLRTPRSYAADDVTETTSVGEPVGPEEWPPEFYDDDLAIADISNCPLAESLSAGERLQFDAVYENDRARSGVMGIYTAYVWEGGGPAAPGPGGADPIPGTPTYTG